METFFELSKFHINQKFFFLQNHEFFGFLAFSNENSDIHLKLNDDVVCEQPFIFTRTLQTWKLNQKLGLKFSELSKSLKQSNFPDILPFLQQPLNISLNVSTQNSK
jgi:hypothetical protein